MTATEETRRLFPRVCATSYDGNVLASGSIVLWCVEYNARDKRKCKWLVGCSCGNVIVRERRAVALGTALCKSCAQSKSYFRKMVAIRACEARFRGFDIRDGSVDLYKFDYEFEADSKGFYPTSGTCRATTQMEIE